ncbi:O-antigen ligase family protein [Alsobacter sp. KACC 23698]|uniref:O-antigen ligase family protein n=1 Tax=Alsobacter sp. KACC 23698 TaxID=3149229 RepID=A0AAU7JJ93_9HYPH
MDRPARVGVWDRVYGLIPVLGCFFALVLSPLILLGAPENVADDPGRMENKLFWIALATLCMTLALGRLGTGRLDASLIWLVLYLGVAGASVYWAFAPDVSLKRFFQQILIVLCMVTPVVTSDRRDWLFRSLFLCFALGVLLNMAALALRPTTALGHPGIYSSKNTLGLAAALALIVALHETTRPGARARILGGLVASASVFLLVLSQSKTSLALAVACPMLAGALLVLCRSCRLTLRSVMVHVSGLLALLLFLLSAVLELGVDDWLQLAFGDPTLTGRTTIWAFAADMIARRPALGWGYQSFWMVGPDAPSVREAPGFVSQMPHAHNGYLDVLLETGWIGLVLMVLFMLSSLRAIDRIGDFRRAWLLLSLMLFTIFYNATETTIGRSFSLEWLVFLLVCADAGALAAESRARRIKRA